MRRAGGNVRGLPCGSMLPLARGAQRSVGLRNLRNLRIWASFAS